MAAKKGFHMNAGDGETSYANHSTLQKAVISTTLNFYDEALEDMLINSDDFGFAKCFKMVDLGSSSGPNALLATCHIIDKIEDLWKQKNITNDEMVLEFEVFLNDLPDNDFNNLFKSLPEKNGRYFFYGLPGSFYGRLLPRNSAHFAYSSYSIHWLSQVPEGLENKNQENIYMAMTSSREVYEAYAKQYQKDFCKFLSLRAEEIISGGRMVLTFIGRSVEDPSTGDDFPTLILLAKTLVDMVAEGIVKKDELHSFNIPLYSPCTQEVEAAIQIEGSFTLDKMQSFRANGIVDTKKYSEEQRQDPLIIGKAVADSVRACTEPLLTGHFGSSIIDDLFGKYAYKLATERLSRERIRSSFSIVISLTKK